MSNIMSAYHYQRDGPVRVRVIGKIVDGKLVVLWRGCVWMRAGALIALMSGTAATAGHGLSAIAGDAVTISQSAAPLAAPAGRAGVKNVLPAIARLDPYMRRIAWSIVRSLAAAEQHLQPRAAPGQTGSAVEVLMGMQQARLMTAAAEAARGIWNVMPTVGQARPMAAGSDIGRPQTGILGILYQPTSGRTASATETGMFRQIGGVYAAKPDQADDVTYGELAIALMNQLSAADPDFAGSTTGEAGTVAGATTATAPTAGAGAVTGGFGISAAAEAATPTIGVAAGGRAGQTVMIGASCTPTLRLVTDQPDQNWGEMTLTEVGQLMLSEIGNKRLDEPYEEMRLSNWGDRLLAEDGETILMAAGDMEL